MHNLQRKTAVFLLTLLTLAFLIAAGRYLQAVQLWLTPPPAQVVATAPLLPTQPFSKALLWERPFVLSELESIPTRHVAELSKARSSAFQERGLDSSATRLFAELVGETAVSPKADKIDEITLAATPAPEPAQLIIPSLGVTRTITNVLVRDGQWDITELGNQIGHLQTTGTHPEDETAMTFVGHVTLPRPELIGPFVDLIKLDHGETIIYRWQNSDYIYTVDATYIVPPTSVDKLYYSESGYLILATCTGWNRSDRAFDERLVIRAQLITQEPTRDVKQPPSARSHTDTFINNSYSTSS